jgi:hypothetical protein
MTESSSNTSSQSTTAPGAEAQPVVQGITGQLDPLIANSGITGTQQTAINQLTQNGVNGDQFAPAEATNANTLLSGGGATSENPALSGNLTALQNADSQIAGATPGSSTVNSPAVQAALQSENAQIANQVNSQFAAAGRSDSGANAGDLAYQESLADTPLLLNQANTDTQNQLTTANNLFSAGNTTANNLTQNNQTALGNEQTGNTAATSAIQAENEGPTAAIEAQELGQSIPASNLGLLAQIGIPLAGLNTSTSGTSNTTSTPSVLQDITGLGGVLGSAGGVTTAANGASTVSNGSGLLGLLGAL